MKSTKRDQLILARIFSQPDFMVSSYQSPMRAHETAFYGGPNGCRKCEELGFPGAPTLKPKHSRALGNRLRSQGGWQREDGSFTRKRGTTRKLETRGIK